MSVLKSTKYYKQRLTGFKVLHVWSHSATQSYSSRKHGGDKKECEFGTGCRASRNFCAGFTGLLLMQASCQSAANAACLEQVKLLNNLSN